MAIHPPRLQFLGAASTVTGSKYLLHYQDRKILIDCGLFQGLKDLRLKNWEAFPVDPRTIDAIVLTHAHIDHSGYIPRLIKEGFRGKVYCTRATLELCRILLPDTGYLQEEEAEYLNRRRLSKHQPALPLFGQKDAEESLRAFVPHDFDKEFELAPGLSVTFIYAGHILGAAQAIVRAGDRVIGFSGDLGRLQNPIFYPPAPPPPLDYLVVESTYGDRRHEDAQPMEELAKIVNQAHQDGGVVMIPAFTVGRAQEIMYFLAQLKKSKRIPDLPMYLNSPMATNVTSVFSKFRALHRLSERECDETCGVVHYVKNVEESKELNLKKGPMVIISASGMLTGGRILHHIKTFGADPKNFIVLSGFQALGTRGRKIQDGGTEIKIFGELSPIGAQVRTLQNLSAHADYTEILTWIRDSQLQPKKVFVTHGEPSAAEAMKEKLRTELGLDAVVPVQDQEFLLD